LRLLLESQGHRVRAALDGVSALEEAVSFGPEIALLDIGLPIIDGYEVARRLRASSHGASMRLIAVTGWGQDADRKKAAAAGFDEHLTKNVDFDALTRLIAAPSS
jgi:CheY-like chemotaxis protein